MNEEAYNKTNTGGKMTYYSRSRQTFWLKAELAHRKNYEYTRNMEANKSADLWRK